MNSDLHENAAWRNFGMLDADEAAAFDEAARHDPALQAACLEMDRLSAAIAACSTPPLTPRPGQLERLQLRLNLHPAKRSHLWLGLSGWAAAAVLAMVLVLDKHPISSSTPLAVSANPQPESASQNSPASHSFPIAAPTPLPPETAGPDDALKTKPSTQSEPEWKTTAKVETKQLVQEIEVLRGNLEKFQNRDRVLFQVAPGIALPVVMTMSPPASGDAASSLPPEMAQADTDASITALLGDAIKKMNTSSLTTSDAPLSTMRPNNLDSVNELSRPDPTAIPIYDAARDAGTLVVNNLPATSENEVYNLWVTTEASDQPVYVGSLPKTQSTSSDSYDFNLGSTRILPSSFTLTRDVQDAPRTPASDNTVLQGPSATRR